MSNIIHEIKLSKHVVEEGETFFVEVDCKASAAGKKAIVTINGVDGASQYRQLTGSDGSRYLLVTATTPKGQSEQSRVKVTLISRDPKLRPYPVIQATESRYTRRSVLFGVGNSNSDGLAGASYEWDFGDGTHGEGNRVEHDYTSALKRDELTTNFDVMLTAHFSDGTSIVARRTIAVFNLYAYNKQRGVLCPRAKLTTLPTALTVVAGDIVSVVELTNLEDESIKFTEMRIELLDSSPDSISQVPKPSPTDLVLEPRQTRQVPVRLPKSSFTKGIFGFAVHWRGRGLKTKTSAVASMYVKVKNPPGIGGQVTRTDLVQALDALSRASLRDCCGKISLTHEDLQSIFASRTTGAFQRAIQTKPADPVSSVRAPAQVGRSLETSREIELRTEPLSPPVIDDLIHGGMHLPFDPLPIVIGNECDPDNTPDDLPEGTVCQFSGEYAWRFVPGMILNAKKGDVLLSPGGTGVIGQLLKQVSTRQHCSHSGIMTMNHIQVRHSTASEEWLRDHAAGSFLGNRGTNGFETDALRYLWPGTVTQGIDQATYGEPMTAPGGKTYMISSFSFYPNRADHNTLAFPMVVKPPHHFDSPDIRKKLHQVAEAALGINGHYRFYGYSRPQFALDSGGIAPASAGWAAGTVPTVCSSLIWLACQKASIRVEGPESVTPVNEIEPTDVVHGAKVGTDTLDGLYLYSADERRKAAQWLYNYIYNEAHNKAGFWGTLFTDAPDNVANQICNAFASDYIDEHSMNSEAWQNTGDANAVSPDNLMFWDSPDAGNQDDFRSVYGYAEELFYAPGTYEKVPIYRWRQVPTRGDLAGIVIAPSGSVDGADVSLQGSGQADVSVGADGKFAFADVPEGDYQIVAGRKIGDYYYRAGQFVSIAAGVSTDVTLTLQAPPEINRQVTIAIYMEITNKSIAASSPTGSDQTKTVWLHPFHSHESISFEQRYSANDPEPRGAITFDLNLNADLSVNVTWTAQEIDDEVECELKGAFKVDRDRWQSFTGLCVSNDDPIDADWTTMEWTMTNAQA